MIILILTDKLDQAKSLVEKLELDNPLVWDETIINEGVQVHPNDVNYTALTVKRAANLVANFKAKRPLVVILDMLRWSAVEKIQHDISILLYDGAKNRRLFHNVQYVPNFKLGTLDDRSINQLKKLIDK